MLMYLQVFWKKVNRQFQSQTSFSRYHTEVTLSGLWENIELSKDIMSTYHDGTTIVVVLSQGVKGCLGV